MANFPPSKQLHLFCQCSYKRVKCLSTKPVLAVVAENNIRLNITVNCRCTLVTNLSAHLWC